MTEETVAMSPVSAICLLPQFIGCSSAGSSPPGHLLVSSQLRWHCSVVTGHHHCARTARVPARRMGTAPEYELSPPPPPAARLAAPTHSVSGWQDSFLTHTHVAQSPILPGSLPHSRNTGWGRIWSLHHLTGATYTPGPHCIFKVHAKIIIKNLYDT